MKNRSSASTHKKVIVLLFDKSFVKGYLNPAHLGKAESVEILTPEGEHVPFPLNQIRSIYFVQEFTDDFEPARKVFLSRPKLEGLWVRLRFTDGESIEGVVPNDLLSLLDNGVQITPPDLNSATLRMFIPRAALKELTVLGVVGLARRKPSPAAEAAQTKLFTD